jgi:hypothetical protein
MTKGDARMIQRSLDALLELRDQPLVRTNCIFDNAMCWAMITLADRSCKVLGESRGNIDGYVVRSRWPKQQDWVYKGQ